MKFTWVAIALIILFGAVSSAPAWAQLSGKDGPVDIESDNLEVIDSKNLAIYKGHVDVVQDDARLQADRIEVQFAVGEEQDNNGALNASWGEIQTITAIGNVFYTTPGEVARGDRGVYRVTTDTITMTGDVVVTQDGNIIRSQKLEIDVKTGEAVFIAGEPGRKSKNRVRSVFFPKKSSE